MIGFTGTLSAYTYRRANTALMFQIPNMRRPGANYNTLKEIIKLSEDDKRIDDLIKVVSGILIENSKNF